MTLVDNLFHLWQDPIEGPEAYDAFAGVYCDPVIVNGNEMALADLVVRARTLQGALAGLKADILQVVEGDGSLAIAFVMRGRHTGDYPGPFGVVPPTGREVAIRTIDVLTLTGGRISRIWVNADDLSLLRQIGAIGG
jgi:predicted ester cyclase